MQQERAAATEADFLNAILHENPDDPDPVVVYEIRKGTRESWLRDQIAETVPPGI